MVKNIFTEKKKKFFFSFKDRTLIKQTEFEDKIYLIKSKSDDLKWKFTKETKAISGYTCYKATTIKRKKYPSGYKNIIVTAWYTNSIPIQSGPNKYVGLPGLIVELIEGSRTFVLKKIIYTDNINIKSLKGKEITEEEFKKIWMAGLSNFR
jgi:GLPGLI family protein